MRILARLLLQSLAVTALQGLEETNLTGPEKTRTLILTDNEALYATHSVFINDLRQNGHKVTTKFINSESIIANSVPIIQDQEYLYDNVILMSTSLEDLTTSKSFNLQEFYDKGGNIFFIGDFDTSEKFRNLANEFGFNFEKSGSYLVDYQKAYTKTAPNLFWTSNYKEFPFLSDGVKNDLLYNGVGLKFTHYETDQITVFLRGNIHTASILYDEVNAKKFGTLGKNVVLVAGIQGINNARLVAAGSLDMFSDELFSKSKESNRVFAKNLIEWMSHKKGFLRLRNNNGTCVDSENKTSECPVRSKFIYDLEIEEWNFVKELWAPYNADDVYFELHYMDIKMRKRMDRISDGKYHIKAHVPDKMGSYAMKLRYNRPGYSQQKIDEKIFVRPWHYKENTKNWDRDSPAALGVVAILGGFVCLSLVFLYDKSRLETI